MGVPSHVIGVSAAAATMSHRQSLSSPVKLVKMSAISKRNTHVVPYNVKMRATEKKERFFVDQRVIVSFGEHLYGECNDDNH